MDFKISQEEKDRNKRLIEKYPWLMPWNRGTGRNATDGFFEGEKPDYDYEWTEWDAMPSGWRKAFGDQMLEDINNELIENGDVNKFRIVQLKEKYGSLRLYTEYATKKIDEEIIPYYEKLSLETCIKCGEPATGMTIGWISPYCDKCAARIEYDRFMTFEELEGGGSLIYEQEVDT